MEVEISEITLKVELVCALFLWLRPRFAHYTVFLVPSYHYITFFVPSYMVFFVRSYIGVKTLLSFFQYRI